jgi:hypothetical protein
MRIKMTPLMQNILMECHERELLGQEPCNPGETKFAKGLFARGLIELRNYKASDGKIKLGFYITDAGKRQLALRNENNRI